jgi:hypothetical protein
MELFPSGNPAWRLLESGLFAVALVVWSWRVNVICVFPTSVNMLVSLGFSRKVLEIYEFLP